MDLLARPVTRLGHLQRQHRQVVQPKWLSNPDFLFIDPNVHVTGQNLKEAAAIRESIQRAISAGTFAINVGQADSSIPTMEFSDSDATRSQPIFPRFDFSNFEFGFPSSEQRSALATDIQRFWEEIVENSRSFFNIFT